MNKEEKVEKVEMRITPLTIIEFNKILDYIAENGEYLARIGDLNLIYKGIAEDTINGKRQMFYIERKINE